MAKLTVRASQVMTWDRMELIEKVKNNHGDEQCELLELCSLSIVKRLCFARYHFSEIKKLKNIDIAEFMNDKWNNRMRIEAHIFAIMQCMHGIADTLAHVIYYATAMNIKDPIIYPKVVTILSVKKKLNPEIKKSNLVNLITELICNDDFKFLNDYVNHSKHHYLVGSSLIVGGIEDSYHFESPKFSHHDNIHDKKSILEFIELEYSRQSELIIKTGIELNSSV
ncbi:hypothetical protein C8R26_11766 [Nitrosomonas oligotropha]|uniref:Uncharacterized protein n=1 Tax=Nitrosomonas oligotropha TaxID=42354 RepID=A0A2T5HY09_9PROT|nr:hypothetical protein [Nitrosomonas oligotropha]PTQ76473.1 hypothetical protein C8R26_11766 [Nitrosomonas oligotropha]